MIGWPVPVCPEGPWLEAGDVLSSWLAVCPMAPQPRELRWVDEWLIRRQCVALSSSSSSSSEKERGDQPLFGAEETREAAASRSFPEATSGPDADRSCEYLEPVPT